jgi:hypothetical protein
MPKACRYRLLSLVLTAACAFPAVADEPRAGPSGPLSARDRADRRPVDAAAVNPFTGTDLAVERKQVELERAKLDEQIAAAELNRRKYQLEMQRLGATPDLASFPGTLPGTLPGLPVATPPMPPAAVSLNVTEGTARAERASAARPSAATSATPASARRKAAQSAVAGPAKSPQGIVLVAVVESGGSRRAVFSADGRYLRAVPGDVVLGRRLDSVDAKSAVLGGQTLTLRDDVPTIAGVSRKTERARSADDLAAGRPEAMATVPFGDAAVRPQDIAAGLAGAVPPLTR